MASTAILDATGTPIRPQSSPVQIRDTVTEAISFGCNAASFGRPNGILERMFAPQMAAAAYLTSGMLQKVIDIPASDRIREWRDWQGADKEMVDAIEAEERRLQIQAKFRFCEVLRGTGGGALILVASGAPATELRPDTIAKDGLIAVNVARRGEITPEDFDRELASPTYGEPRRWRVNTGNGGTILHPSRVIAFRGDPYPSSMGVSDEDQFWGLSRLVRVYREVMKSDNAQAWFADLVRKAKLLRIGIPGLTDFTATDDGQARLNRRMAAIAMSENGLNATVFDAGGINQPGETITDYQVSWAGIPAVMDAFDQRVAAVADIPFTRLMGRSPAGMNATGAHDEANYNAMVAAGQNLDVRPCLDRLDAVMLRSAGVDPADLWYRFSPLSKPSPTEEATRFKTTADALKTIADARVMPERAFAAGAQSTIEENGWMPGAIPELAKMSEDERFGLDPAYDPSLGDPSALTVPQAKGGGQNLEGGAGGGGSAPARRAANDAKPIPLYVQRKLLNAGELIAWAKAQGLTSTLAASDMHVTVLYSRTPVDPIKLGNGWDGNDKGEITIKPGGPRAVEMLGDSAVVLLFASDDLSWRHRSMVENGASHDYPEYQPHVTLTYEAGDVDLTAIKPYAGKLVFGPEIFEPLDLDWKQKVTEE